MRLAKKYFHLKSNAVYNSSAKNCSLKFNTEFIHVCVIYFAMADLEGAREAQPLSS